ncbi:unnamed protein product [Paramecium pentaurelia]|uniref:Arylamine N-acetyltransferase n=1 Tax=Paramecium pentaurelia TaxID=43138 RepID=A0A8S1WK20_9CILI|nr:unnamed protein product [Paramecium pentaurelia]
MQQSISKEDLKTYLKGIGLPTDIQLSVSVETLYLLTNKQFIYTFYQNTNAHLKELKPISLEFVDILHRLCVQKIGGLCYEHELLLYNVLKHLGFQVELIRCFIQKAGPYNPNQPTTHSLMYVKINKEIFLIDIGFGIRSLRYPILIDFQNLTNSYDLFPFEHFRIIENETLYSFQHLIDGSWVTCYHFFNPIQFQTQQDIKQDCQNYLASKQFLVGGDNRIQICKNTEYGKIQYLWFRNEQQFTAFKKIHNFDKATKIEFANYEDFKVDIKQEIGFLLPERTQLR